MSYSWYNIFNLDEFEALDLVSKEYELILEDNGLKTIMVTNGNGVSVLIDDVFLTINLNSRNPFAFEDRAVYLDADNDVWVGIAIES